MIPLDLSPLLDGFTLPDGYGGEELVLGWRSINPDGTSRRDGYRWPDPGNWTPRETADRADVACSHGLHVARTWAGASSAGPIRAALLVAYRPGDVAHVDAHKVRVDQALVLARFDPVAPIRAGWMAGADLRDADLRRSNLRYADLTGADLRRSNLTRSNLRYADLMGADLRYANLTGADLTGADLRDANLTRSNLRGADLRGAVANDATVWPDGFDPTAAGVTVL